MLKQAPKPSRPATLSSTQHMSPTASTEKETRSITPDSRGERNERCADMHGGAVRWCHVTLAMRTLMTLVDANRKDATAHLKPSRIVSPSDTPTVPASVWRSSDEALEAPHLSSSGLQGGRNPGD